MSESLISQEVIVLPNQGGRTDPAIDLCVGCVGRLAHIVSTPRYGPKTAMLLNIRTRETGVRVMGSLYLPLDRVMLMDCNKWTS